MRTTSYFQTQARRRHCVDLVQLTEAAYQLRGGANAGLIAQGGHAVLVDTGMDRDTAKKILRHIESLKITLAAVVITHAHADHCGGAAMIRARTGVPVYAPALEADVVANPIWEPLYLFSGALPPAELRHKFTLAEPCPVDGILGVGEQELGGVQVTVVSAQGHAPNQMIVAGGGACFVADACFAPEILYKHGIPFYVDIDQALASLAALAALDGAHAAFVPGHGPAVPQIAAWAAGNTARLVEIRETVARALAETDDVGQIIRRTANHFGVTIPNPVIFWLTQTTVLACLASLQRAGRASVRVVDNALVWGPVVGLPAEQA
jgi:glyoxylase-like metal-dependent hydrolase (beta-lactamase superfamily II)